MIGCKNSGHSFYDLYLVSLDVEEREVHRSLEALLVGCGKLDHDFFLLGSLD